MSAPSATTAHARRTTSVPATTCCFTPDGAFLLAGTSKGSIHVFDAYTGKVRFPIQSFFLLTARKLVPPFLLARPPCGNWLLMLPGDVSW